MIAPERLGGFLRSKGAPVALLVAFAALSAAADEAPVVDSLRFEGVTAVPRAALEERVLTTRRSWRPWVESARFDEETLREDLERIAAAYRERGWYEARAEYELTWREDRSAVDVKIVVEEGEPVRLAEATVRFEEGAPLSPEQRDAAGRDLPLAPGAIFAVADYQAAKALLLERLANLGHPAAALEGGADVDLAAHAARVSWRVDAGPRVRFGAVRVEGLERVEEPLALRELTFREGERFSRKALVESQRAIYGLGLFRWVSLQPERPKQAGQERTAQEPREASASEATDAVWPVVVSVEERPPRSVRVGGGYGTEDKLRARASWINRNYFGQARLLELSGRYSALVIGGEARLTQPRFLEWDTSLDANASFLRETVPAYDANRAGAGFVLSRPFGERWTARTGYRFEWTNLTDLKAQTPTPDVSLLSTLLFGVRRSTLDDALEPRSGTWLDLAFEPNLKPLGARVSFLTATAEGRAFFPLWFAVLAMRLEVGTIEPLDARDTEVSILSRFFSGGSTSVRGFEYERLGPLDRSLRPVGGLTRAEASTELRYPIWKMLSGVAFIDAGQLALEPLTLRHDDFFYTAGAGIRVKTPIGALRLDWGYILNPLCSRPDPTAPPPDPTRSILRGRDRRGCVVPGVDRWRIHLAVGHAF